jgi:hypothetical protein
MGDSYGIEEMREIRENQGTIRGNESYPRVKPTKGGSDETMGKRMAGLRSRRGKAG